MSIEYVNADWNKVNRVLVRTRTFNAGSGGTIRLNLFDAGFNFLGDVVLPIINSGVDETYDFDISAYTGGSLAWVIVYEQLLGGVGDCDLNEIVAYGDGNNPFGTDNC
jgi:hypothetical protein